MKKYLLLVATGILMCTFLHGQVICVSCYQQNNPVSTGVNNLLLNGGFENGACIPYGQTGYGSCCTNSVFYSCDIPDWICTGGGSSTKTGICDDSYCRIAEGARAACFGNGLCKACSGTTDDTSCISNMQCVVSGIPGNYPRSTPFNGLTEGVSLQQTVSGLTPGNIYVLEFWTGGGDESLLYLDNGLFSVDVGFGKIFLQNNSTAPGPDTSIGMRYIVQFVAASSSHTIRFTSWGHICFSCAELVLDDVLLYTQGELSSSVSPCVTGINAQDESSSPLIYPNPNDGRFVISIPGCDNKESRVQIVNGMGQIVWEQTADLRSDGKSVQINMARSLSPGVYTARIICSSGQKTERFIISRNEN